MAPLYRGFLLTECAHGWRYRHLEHPDLGGSRPSLLACFRAIDDLHRPALRPRDGRVMLAAAVCALLVYGVIAWVAA